MSDMYSNFNGWDDIFNCTYAEYLSKLNLSYEDEKTPYQKIADKFVHEFSFNYQTGEYTYHCELCGSSGTYLVHKDDCVLNILDKD